MIHERFRTSFSRWDNTASNKRAAVARADHIICVSENTRRDLIEILDVNPEKTTVVHLASSQMHRMPYVDIAASSRPYLLYVGERRGYKNFDLLLQAYALSPQLQRHCDIVLFGGEGSLRWEYQRARELGLRSDNFNLIHGDDARLASLYRGALLFVYPSLYEGFGIPPLEAMTCGCPVVCSSAGSLPEVVGDAAEIFDPQLPDSLLAAIERVLRDMSYRANLVQKGFERASSFSWQRCAEQTMAVYKQVLL
jgi:glycosyltransferase involved in cell wall biosynthesis